MKFCDVLEHKEFQEIIESLLGERKPDSISMDVEDIVLLRRIQRKVISKLTGNKKGISHETRN